MISTIRLYAEYAGAVLAALLRGVSPEPFELWYYGYPLGQSDFDIDPAWLCSCGHYEESGLHCAVCGEEPPWGCDCPECEEEGMFSRDEWMAEWDIYPGDLLAGDANFGSAALPPEAGDISPTGTFDGDILRGHPF